MTTEPSEPALEVDGLTCSFGGIHAVRGVSFQIETGSMVGLIGPNGAGKTTVLQCIAGQHRRYGGRISAFGVNTTGAPAYKLGQLGVVRTFQTARPFSKLSVLSNLLTGPQNQKGERLVSALAGSWRQQQRELLANAWERLRIFELEGIADNYGSELSGGQQRLVDLSRALMASPRMLLLDEPFAGVSPTNRARLAGQIEQACQAGGLTVLMVEHRLEYVDRLCDRVIAMAEGQIIAEGSMSEIREERRVLEAYLGVT